MGGDTETSARIGRALQERGQTLAVAESLTGGLLANAFAVAPAASAWFPGGTVTYTVDAKQRVLGVPPGPVVTEGTAVAMARGVRELYGADHALGVTGAGGPDAQDGQPPGTVWIAVVDAGEGIRTRRAAFTGEPAEVCSQACSAAVALLGEHLGLAAGDGPPARAPVAR